MKGHQRMVTSCERRVRAKQPKDHNHAELFNGMGWLDLLQTGWRLPSTPSGWELLVLSFSMILLHPARVCDSCKYSISLKVFSTEFAQIKEAGT